MTIATIYYPTHNYTITLDKSLAHLFYKGKHNEGISLRCRVSLFPALMNSHNTEADTRNSRMPKIAIECVCGKRIRAGARHAGKRVRCPQCKELVRIPAFDIGNASHNANSSEPPAWNNLSEIMTWLILAWVVVMGLVVGVCVAIRVPLLTIAGVFAAMSVFLGLVILGVFLAKARAMSRHEEEKSVLFGFARMVLWEPTEGILFLKNKQVHAVDNNPNDGGGIRYMFPILGEQVGLRAPLTIQSTPFTDHQVFTKDYLPVSIRMTIWWQLADLECYYLSISNHKTTTIVAGDDSWDDEEYDGHRKARSSQLGQAKSWIAMMAESVGRQELAKTSTAFLVANQISSDLPKNVRPTEGTGQGLKSYDNTTRELAGRLESGIRNKIKQYGLEIDRVELQEIMLPKEIHAAAVEACSAAFLPAKAEREAAARKIQLQADADVLGADAVAIREVLDNADGMSFLGVPDFLENLFGRMGQNRRISQQDK